jgi:hypothetical protein
MTENPPDKIAAGDVPQIATGPGGWPIRNPALPVCKTCGGWDVVEVSVPSNWPFGDAQFCPSCAEVVHRAQREYAQAAVAAMRAERKKS